MSGDHNQNQSNSGWRKRQIALDIKAENAKELGLDYEPEQKPMHPELRKMWEDYFDKFFRDNQFSKCFGAQPEPDKTIIEMARRAGAVFPADGSYHQFERHEDLETFAALVRADEREACAKLRDTLHPFDLHNRSEMLGVMNQGLDDYAAAIRARGQA